MRLGGSDSAFSSSPFIDGMHRYLPCESIPLFIVWFPHHWLPRRGVGSSLDQFVILNREQRSMQRQDALRERRVRERWQQEQWERVERHTLLKALRVANKRAATMTEAFDMIEAKLWDQQRQIDCLRAALIGRDADSEIVIRVAEPSDVYNPNELDGFPPAASQDIEAEELFMFPETQELDDGGDCL